MSIFEKIVAHLVHHEGPLMWEYGTYT